MKIVGVAMVRNEADIVEAFVRHNLSYLDGLVVVDHGSADATLDILNALCRERLPLVVLRNETVGYMQQAVMTQVVRQALASTGADFVFPLDADEFLKVGSRRALEEALRALPRGVHGSLDWLTYVPDLADPSRGILEALRAARHARHPHLRMSKVVVARILLDAPNDVLFNGNHGVTAHPDATDRSERPHAPIDERAAALAHVPVRSFDQFVVKLATKKLGRIAAKVDWPGDSGSQTAYEVLRSGRQIDLAWIRHAAINWTVRAGEWLDESEVSIEPDPFLAPIALRYTPPAAASALPLVLAAVERLARRLGQAAVSRTG